MTEKRKLLQECHPVPAIKNKGIIPFAVQWLRVEKGVVIEISADEAFKKKPERPRGN